MVDVMDASVTIGLIAAIIALVTALIGLIEKFRHK